MLSFIFHDYFYYTSMRSFSDWRWNKDPFQVAILKGFFPICCIFMACYLLPDLAPPTTCHRYDSSIIICWHFPELSSRRIFSAQMPSLNRLSELRYPLALKRIYKGIPLTSANHYFIYRKYVNRKIFF